MKLFLGMLIPAVAVISLVIDAIPANAQERYSPQVINRRWTRERQDSYDRAWDEYWSRSPQQRQGNVYYPYGSTGQGDPLRNSPNYRTPFIDGNGVRFRYINPNATPQPNVPHSTPNSNFDSLPPLRGTPQALPFGPTSQYRPSQKRSPKGVSMRIGIDRGSYQRAVAPRSLLAAIRKGS